MYSLLSIFALFLLILKKGILLCNKCKSFSFKMLVLRRKKKWRAVKQTLEDVFWKSNFVFYFIFKLQLQLPSFLGYSFAFWELGTFSSDFTLCTLMWTQIVVVVSQVSKFNLPFCSLFFDCKIERLTMSESNVIKFNF